MPNTLSRAADAKPFSAAIGRPMRLETLVKLRWLAVAGQALGVGFTAFGLGYPLPLAECLSLIGLSVLLNIWLVLRYGAPHRVAPEVALLQLAYDCLQLGGLLALTGGLQNPFSLLLLAPVSVSATTLSQGATFVLALLATVIASLLAVVHLPLPWDPESRIVFDRVYIIGIWVSLLCGVVFVAAYTNRVAREARQLADALAATELALSRHEQLSALDGLAAAAAHELGTPLSTIALAAKEMRADIPPGPLAEDVDLIISQSARCRTILAKLRNLGAGDDPFAAVPLGELLAEVASPHENLGKAILFENRGARVSEPVFPRNVGLLYGLGNLIENATHFATEKVVVEAIWDDRDITVVITDDGPGFPLEVVARLGEPYLTTRARNLDPAGSGMPGGLGLGIFIAKTLLERTGARLAFQNQGAQGHAQVRVVWPRQVIETARPDVGL